MARPFTFLTKWDSNAPQNRKLRPIAIAIGFCLTILLLLSLRTDSDELSLVSQEVMPSVIYTCEAWFEEQDQANKHLLTGRDFDEEPVTIYEVGLPEWFRATEKDLEGCDIECRPIPYDSPEARTITHWDATTDEWPKAPQDIDHSHGFAIIRNVEPPNYYPALAIDVAHKAGYDIVMTSELASDVPIPYVGVAISDFFEPELPYEQKKKAAMAVISNCGAKSFRLEAIKKMQELGVQVDSYGFCSHNKDFPEPENFDWNEEGRTKRYRQKMALARTYMFYLSFENSQYPDYVTEKFFQALQTGNVPVVIGASNVAEFAPGENSFLYLESLEDVPALVKRMKYLMRNRSAYEEMLDWKHHEASDSFKVINDVMGVHHTCRLCIHVATKLQAVEDEKMRKRRQGEDGQSVIEHVNETPMKESPERKRLDTRVPLYPCTCRPSKIRPPVGFSFLDELIKGESEVHRLYLRERGTFRYRSVLMDGSDLSIQALHAAVLRAFETERYVPTWVDRRKEMGINWTSWQVHRIHPSGITLRDAFGAGSFRSDDDFRTYLAEHSCPKLEVIFV